MLNGLITTVRRLHRFYNSLALLAHVHLEVFQLELRREEKRLVMGAMFMALGAAVLLFFVMLLHVAGVLLAYQLGLTWLGAALVVAGVDLLLAVVFLLLGARKVKGPYFPETRTLAVKTVETIKQEA